MEKKIILFFAVFVFTASSVSAQNVVRGRVVDKDGLPIPGARVTVKGGTESVLSEFDGSFRIPTESAKKKLIIDYVGYNSKTISADRADKVILRPTTFWNDMIVMANVGVFPQLSYGLMVGCVRKFGGYVKCRSDFNFMDNSMECTSDGYKDAGVFWASGSEKRSRINMTAGVMVRASKNIYPYLGAGYGSAVRYWEDYKGNWAKVTDLSSAGLAAEAGLVFRFGSIALSTGVSTSGFEYSEVEVGIGIMF